MAIPGVKGTQNLSAAFSGTLWADVADPNLVIGSGGGVTVPPFESVAVSLSGASAEVERYWSVSSGYLAWNNGSAVGTQPPDCPDDAWALIDTTMGAVSLDHVPYDVVFVGTVWKVTASAPSASDSYLLISGAYGWQHPGDGGPVFDTGILPTTTITAAYTLGFTGVKAWWHLAENPPDPYHLRDVRQRNLTAGWWGDSSSTVTATCGSASASGNLGFTGETSVDAELYVSIGLNSAPVIHTDYANVTVNGSWSGSPGAVDLSKITVYRDTHTVGSNGHDGSLWHWHGTSYDPSPPYDYSVPADADTLWKTVVSSGAISIQRCAGAASNATGSIAGLLAPRNIRALLRLGKAYHPAGLASDSPYRYNSYIDTVGGVFIGHPFDVGLYKHWKAGGVRQTDAEVSVAPSWTAVDYQELVPDNDFTLPDDIWRVGAAWENGVSVYLRGAWCAANNEDVPFTDPLTMATVTPIGGATPVNVLMPVTIPGLSAGLFDDPHCDGVSAWMTFTRTELNLDIPATAGARPSEWTVGAVPLSPQTTWVVPTGGVTVSRTLATRRRNRAIRFSAHLWTGSGDQQEVSHDWPYMTLANYAGANPTTGDIPDDPKWWDPNATPWPGEEVGCLYEDVADWRSFSVVQLSASGATVDIPVTLRLTYRETDYDVSNDSRYLGATYNFGSGGDAAWVWTVQKTLEVAGTLYYATGLAVFDLCPDVGQLTPNLELIEKVEFSFSAVASAQTLTSIAWATVPYDAAHQLGIPGRMRMAHLFGSNPFGATSCVDGMPNYVPTLIDSIGPTIWRNERGWSHTQGWQHNPDYEGPPDDPTVLNSLALWYNRWTYAEHILRPTWHQDLIDAATKDVDGKYLGTPYFGDFDMEVGFCLHAGRSWQNGFVGCDVILGGAWEGVAKDAGVREVNLGATSLELDYSDDDGATKTTVETKGTDAVGAFIVAPVREKTPRMAWLKAGGGWLTPKSMVNEEWWWAAATNVATQQWVHSRRYNGRIVAVGLRSGAVVVQTADPNPPLRLTYEGKCFADTGAWKNLDISEQAGVLWVHGELAGVTRWSRALTLTGADGTWQEVTAVGMAGVDLLGIAGTYRDLAGCLWVAGYEAVGQRIVVQRGKPSNNMAEVLVGLNTSVLVVACVLGVGEAIPTCSATQGWDGNPWVLVSRTAGAKWYRSRGLASGFTEVTAP